MAAYSGIEINPETGEISATKMPFDYEQQPTVVIQVTASDDKDTHITYATLKVQVLDINDTPPTIHVDVSKRK